MAAELDSSGERKTRPNVMFLDQPTAALAPRMVAEPFSDGSCRSGTAGVGPPGRAACRKALEIADRGYVLVAGRTVMEGTGAAILANED